jgi:hypothetical protein
MPDDLYRRDFYAWTQAQAAALRAAAAAGVNLPLDWPNLIEEIECLGRSERRELGRRMATVAEHLLKLMHSPAVDPRAGWEETVGRARRDIAELLAENPSLRPELPLLVEQAIMRGTRDAADSLARRGEAAPAAVLASRLSEQRLLGDWLPEPPEG